MSKLLYLIALNKLNISKKTIAKLLKRWPDIELMFQLSQTELQQAGLPPVLAQTIANFDLKQTDEDLNWLAASEDHHILSQEHESYPALLKEISDPPIILYAKGNLSALKQATLAIVGSRNPSITGSENAKNFAKEIASYGVTIVSGLALGIDAQAHIGCLEAQEKTVAVLGTGIDTIYPRRHNYLAQQITENGLLISEFPLKSPPIALHFPLRNRIISGISLCTLVIEAAIKSGSLITARLALEQNRDVLAIPGSIHNPVARGCHHLLQQGAKLVTSVADVLDELRIEHVPQAIKKSSDQKKSNLIKYIGHEITSIDQIILRSGLAVEQVLSELALLEMDGSVAVIPGGYIRY